MKQMLNALNILNFISKCTNYIYYVDLLHNYLHGAWFLCN